MTNQEFKQLKDQIKEAFQSLEELQQKYIREVGKRYVPEIKTR